MRADVSPPLKPYIDPEEASAALDALISSDPGLLAELAELFLRDDAPYETSALMGYCFVLPERPTFETDGSIVAFRPRKPMERKLALVALENNKRKIHTPSMNSSVSQSTGI